MTELKNVVIIGLGLAGVNLAKALEKSLPSTHRLVCITENEFAYYPIGSLRAAVVPGWETKTTLPATALFPASSRHVVLGGTQVVELVSTKSLRVDKASKGFEELIEFDVAVVATGSSYAFPQRPNAGSTTEEVVAQYKALQVDIAAATSILVVGGGPTGIEFAGEVAGEYSGKKVTLAHQDSSFFAHDFKKSLGDALASQLKSKSVELFFDAKVDLKGYTTGKIPATTFDLGEGRSVEADFLFVAYGSSPNSGLVKKLDATAVNEKGFVKVGPSLQILGAEGVKTSLFAIADVTDVPEMKLGVHGSFQAPIVAANVVAVLAGKSPAKTYAAGGPKAIVTVGKTLGAGQLFGISVGSWIVPVMKSKTLMVSMWSGNFTAA